MGIPAELGFRFSISREGEGIAEYHIRSINTFVDGRISNNIANHHAK